MIKIFYDMTKIFYDTTKIFYDMTKIFMTRQNMNKNKHINNAR